MFKDPIVEDIHKIREKIAKENDYDLGRIFNRIKENEKKNPKNFTTKQGISKAS